MQFGGGFMQLSEQRSCPGSPAAQADLHQWPPPCPAPLQRPSQLAAKPSGGVAADVASHVGAGGGGGESRSMRKQLYFELTEVSSIGA